MSAGPNKVEPRRIHGLYAWNGCATQVARRNVWSLWDVYTDDGMQTHARWASDESPRHDRHVTPYDPRLIAGCTIARPGPIARFLMSRVQTRGRRGGEPDRDVLRVWTPDAPEGLRVACRSAR